MPTNINCIHASRDRCDHPLIKPTFFGNRPVCVVIVDPNAHCQFQKAHEKPPFTPCSKCGRGYGSRMDGLCTRCRGGVTAWEARQRMTGAPK